MTSLDVSICWAVLAPLSPAELNQLVLREQQRSFAFAPDPSPWEIIPGGGDYSAIICRPSGSEGSDRVFAALTSRQAAGAKIYSLWLNPDMETIFVWQNGQQIEAREGDALDFATSLGFQVTVRQPPARGYALALVEGATVEQVRQALGESAGEAWLSISITTTGVLITAVDGVIGTQAWDAASHLPDAVVYFIQHWPITGRFRILILRGAQEAGVFGSPAFDNEELSEIKGQRSPEMILQALDILPELAGYE